MPRCSNYHKYRHICIISVHLIGFWYFSKVSPSPWRIHAMLWPKLCILWGSIIMRSTFWSTSNPLKCCLLSSLNRCFNLPQQSHRQLQHDFTVTSIWQVRRVCRSTFMMLIKHQLTSVHRRSNESSSNTLHSNNTLTRSAQNLEETFLLRRLQKNSLLLI